MHPSCTAKGGCIATLRSTVRGLKAWSKGVELLPVLDGVGSQVLVAGSQEEDEDPFLARLQDTGDALLADEESGSDGGPSSDDDLGLDEDEDEDDEDEDDDSFEEVAGGGEGEGGKRRRRERRRRRREGRDGDALGGGDNQHNRQRRRAEMRAHRRLRMEYYNRGSFFGRPAGSTLYDMAHLLRKDTSEHLW